MGHLRKSLEVSVLGFFIGPIVVHYSPAAKGGDPKFSDIVFFSADYSSLGSK